MKMKRVFCLLLIAALCAGLLAACGGNGTATDSLSGTATADVSDNATDGELPPRGAPSTAEKTLERREYDPSIAHTVIVTDILNHELVVLDLNKASSGEAFNEEDVVVWRWRSQNSASAYADKIRDGLDDAKYRYSELYRTDVVIACSSSGWAGIIAYPSGKILFEAQVSNGPHSVELMPNGDFIVACADEKNGRLNYYAIGAGGSKSRPAATYKMSGCHGVCWNPDLNRLITDGYDGIHAVAVKGYGGRSIQLMKDDAFSIDFKSKIYCHDLMPVAGMNGTEYYVTADKIYRFVPGTRKMTAVSDPLGSRAAKGIASFEDGSVVITPHGDRRGEPRYDWSTCVLELFTCSFSSGKVQEVRLTPVSTLFTDREFYKVHNFDKNYY